MDRYLYCIDASTSRILWKFLTGKWVVSSPVVCTVADRPAVVFSSLDNRLYVRDALSGQRIWDFETGDMLWPYETRGSTAWSSPVVAEVDGEARMFFGSYDGNLYSFKSVPRCYADEDQLGPRPGETEVETAGSWSPLTYLPPAVGLALIAGSFALVFSTRGRGTGDGGAE
jgi:hypothetical protein